MSGDLRSQILAIQDNKSLSDEQKAVQRQALLSGKWLSPPEISTSAGVTVGHTLPSGRRILSLDRLLINEYSYPRQK